MWKKIISYIMAFLGGIGAIILLIGRRKGNTTAAIKADLDRNNTRIRQGLHRVRNTNKRARDNTDRAGQVINNTRQSVSDIIKNAKKDTGQK